jgi:hypothetical protein
VESPMDDTRIHKSSRAAKYFCCTNGSPGGELEDLPEQVINARNHENIYCQEIKRQHSEINQVGLEPSIAK